MSGVIWSSFADCAPLAGPVKKTAALPCRGWLEVAPRSSAEKSESAEVPDRYLAVPLIRDRLIGLGIQSFKKVKIFGQQTGDDFPDWVEEFELEKPENLPVLTPEVETE